MSDTSSVRSDYSTLSSGAGYDEKGPFLVIVSGYTGKTRILRPGSVITNGWGVSRTIKEGDFICKSFWASPVQMPKSCNSPYVTPTSSLESSPALSPSEHGGDEYLKIPPMTPLAPTI